MQMSNQKKFDLFYYLPSTNSGKRQGGINQRKNVRMPSMEVHNAPCHLFGRTRREYKKREKRERERELQCPLENLITLTTLPAQEDRHIGFIIKLFR